MNVLLFSSSSKLKFDTKRTDRNNHDGAIKRDDDWGDADKKKYEFKPYDKKKASGWNDKQNDKSNFDGYKKNHDKGDFDNKKKFEFKPYEKKTSYKRNNNQKESNDDTNYDSFDRKKEQRHFEKESNGSTSYDGKKAYSGDRYSTPSNYHKKGDNNWRHDKKDDFLRKDKPQFDTKKNYGKAFAGSSSRSFSENFNNDSKGKFYDYKKKSSFKDYNDDGYHQSKAMQNLGWDKPAGKSDEGKSDRINYSTTNYSRKYKNAADERNGNLKEEGVANFRGIKDAFDRRNHVHGKKPFEEKRSYDKPYESKSRHEKRDSFKNNSYFSTERNENEKGYKDKRYSSKPHYKMDDRKPYDKKNSFSFEKNRHNREDTESSEMHDGEQVDWPFERPLIDQFEYRRKDNRLLHNKEQEAIHQKHSQQLSNKTNSEPFEQMRTDRTKVKSKHSEQYNKAASSTTSKRSEQSNTKDTLDKSSISSKDIKTNGRKVRVPQEEFWQTRRLMLARRRSQRSLEDWKSMRKAYTHRASVDRKARFRTYVSGLRGRDRLLHLQGPTKKTIPKCDEVQKEWPSEIKDIVQKAFGFKYPTAIQSLMWRKFLEAIKGNKAKYFCAAPTGTGKTLAALLPLFHRLKQQESQNNGEEVRSVGSPRAFYCVPSHELAAQVLATAKQLSHVCKMRCVEAWNPQDNLHAQRALSSPIDLVIGTTHELLQLILKKDKDKAACKTDALKHLVVDEGDSMLVDDDFRKDLRALVEALPKPLPFVCVMSATVPKVAIEKARALFPSISLIHTPTVHCSVPGIKEKFVWASGLDRFQHLISTLGDFFAPKNKENEKCLEKGKGSKDDGERAEINDDARKDRRSVVVFCHGARKASILYQNLHNHLAQQQHDDNDGNVDFPPPALLHGGLSSKARASILSAFAASSSRLLITTDLASRGWDCPPQCRLLIQYDFAQSPADYLHRIGRVGRMGQLPGARCVAYLGSRDRRLSEIVGLAAKKALPVTLDGSASLSAILPN